MKKIVENVKVNSLTYPNWGVVEVNGKEIKVKNALPEQVVNIALKARKRKQGRLLTVEDRAPYEKESFCINFGDCGGCARQTVDEIKQLELKSLAVKNLFLENDLAIDIADITPSPLNFAYRNKMEYSFGDAEKGGELNLGMHRVGRFYDVVSIPECQIVDEDYNIIRCAVEEYARKNNLAKFNRNDLSGVMRNLVIRKGKYSGEILIGIATSSANEFKGEEFVEHLLSLKLDGKIVGIYHLLSDEVADVVKAHPEDKLIYGRDYYNEEILGLKFKVSFHSFFQTNTLGAELLYQKALGLIKAKDKIVYDLFCGTGTIAQIVARDAKKVYGVEIIADAVKAARENAKINKLANCQFLEGDVFDVLDEVEEKPDLIILDPPRAGLMPKTVEKVASYGVDEILYISCNPKTMASNLLLFSELGYQANDCHLVDMYPHTPLVEAIVLLKKS